MTTDRAPGDASRQSQDRRAGTLRRLAWMLISTYHWILLTSTTLVGYLLCWLLTPFLGKPSGFAVGVQWWAKCNMALGLFRKRVSGLENVPQSAVLVANHRSIFDICLMAAIVPRPVYFVARRGVLEVPIIGSVLKHGGHIMVDRRGGAVNEAQIREAADRARAGGLVVFFPEGTRSPDHKVRRFKNGAFRAAAMAGVPVVPTAIAGTELTVPKHTAYIIAARMSVRFLEPRLVSEGDARSEQVLEEVRSAVEEQVRQLQSEARQRI